MELCAGVTLMIQNENSEKKVVIKNNIRKLPEQTVIVNETKINKKD